MKNFLLYLWQLPQNIVGLILCIFYRTDQKVIYKGKTIRVCGKFPGGISLGNYIFVRYYPVGYMWNYTKHEYGHSVQSLYLGWLYLFVIGIPSILWAAYWNNTKGSYYRFYTEKCADKLGGVNR